MFSTINKATLALEVDGAELETAIQNYLDDELDDRRLSQEVLKTARTIADLAKRKIDEALAQRPAVNDPAYRMMLELVVVTFAGVASEIYDEAVIMLLRKMLRYTQNVIGSDHFVFEAKRDLIGARMTFILELLAFLDGKRYYQVFQYVYCVWDLGRVTG
jgi:hypothetical protein